MGISLELLGAEPLQRGLARSAASVTQEQVRAMTASMVLIEADARRQVAHDTRSLMNSIAFSVTQERAGVVGRVGPSARYGLYVERGARPHWPPRGPLEGWARRHGIPVFLVQRAIARKGARARPFLVPAFTKNLARIRALFGAAVERITVRIAGQG